MNLFYKESKSTHFFFGGGGRGVEGVVWRGGSVARVSGFFLRRIHISKKKKKVLTSF